MNEAAIRKIEDLQLKIYLQLEETLRDGPKYVNYNQIAAECGCSRGAVRYNIGKLLSEGVIVYENNMLSLKRP